MCYRKVQIVIGVGVVLVFGVRFCLFVCLGFLFWVVFILPLCFVVACFLFRFDLGRGGGVLVLFVCFCLLAGGS